MPIWKCLVVVGAIMLAGCGDDDPATVVGTPPALTSADILGPGAYGVGVTTMTFEDTSRETMPNGTFPGAPSRTLVTEIWYPIDTPSRPATPERRDVPVARARRPYPLVIYSHGFMSDRRGGTYLARQLASRGYVVASPDYPLTFSQAPGGANFFDVAEQPGDIRFLIDRLLAIAAQDGAFLGGAIDAQRIGLTGLSLGGMTTFLAAFDSALRDPRVRAAAPMAGVACMFGADFYADQKIPLLVLHGDIDAIVPYHENAAFAYEEAKAPKYLVTIVGGSHTAFADGIEAIAEGANNADDLGCRALANGVEDATGVDTFLDRLGGTGAGIIAGDCSRSCQGPRPRAIRPSRQHQLTILSVVPFFESTLRGDRRAQRFLDATLAAENADLVIQHEQ